MVREMAAVGEDANVQGGVQTCRVEECRVEEPALGLRRLGRALISSLP